MWRPLDNEEAGDWTTIGSEVQKPRYTLAWLDRAAMAPERVDKKVVGQGVLWLLWRVGAFLYYVGALLYYVGALLYYVGVLLYYVDAFLYYVGVLLYYVGAFLYKVNRCLARYSPRATTTNQPKTGHWISLHGLAQIDQKCQFWTKFGRFGAKNPYFYSKNQKFCYPLNRKPTQAPCSRWFLVGHWTKCVKMAIFGPKWPKMQILDQIWPFLGQKA